MSGDSNRQSRKWQGILHQNDNKIVVGYLLIITLRRCMEVNVASQKHDFLEPTLVIPFRRHENESSERAFTISPSLRSKCWFRSY